MSNRQWLEDDLTTRYLPTLRSLEDNEAGHKRAAEMFATMRSAWTQRGLTTLRQQSSCLDRVRFVVKQELGKEHWSLSYIDFSRAEYIEINNQRQKRVADRNEAVKFLDQPDEIVATAVRLLESPEWSEVVAGLSVLTGRRVTELLLTASFQPKTKWSVLFSGALKRRGELVDLSFEIPTLTTAERVCEALSRVRAALPEVRGLEARQINHSYSDAVVRACAKHFQDLVPLREGRDNLYTHLFRSVYATIAVFWYCPPSVNEVEFKATIQGHYQVLDEENPELRRSIATSRHYSDYEIADSVIARYQGKRKGIKLGYGGVEGLEVFSNALQASQPPSTVVREHRASVRIYHSDKALLESIFDDLGLDARGTQQDRMRSLLLWVQGQMKALSEGAVAATMTTTTRPVEAEQGEGLDGSAKGLEEASTNLVVVEAPAVGAGLESKLDKLVDVMSLFVQAQLQKPTPQRERRTLSDSALQQQQELKLKQQGVVEQRKTLRQVNTDRLNHAIDAIIAYNNAPSRTHDQRWAITISILKNFAKSQPKIQNILNERSSEISTHHASHQIDPLTHNYRHRGKSNIANLIHLPDETPSS